MIIEILAKTYMDFFLKTFNNTVPSYKRHTWDYGSPWLSKSYGQTVTLVDNLHHIVCNPSTYAS